MKLFKNLKFRNSTTSPEIESSITENNDFFSTNFSMDAFFTINGKPYQGMSRYVINRKLIAKIISQCQHLSNNCSNSVIHRQFIKFGFY